ncbi:hypothetical protein BD626DRAFT_411246 [Schizophyllum amplum]|uniref:Uracil-DNA glycosylase-like domain-containing protein n=1 Tax=Schizophyllum amplum TaxID=97359 RepID=A0A550BZA4_9AGAR|nr:hypothetical protein BD626DRAFT_411246 [Auriculariopsis ampla]
MLTLGCSPILRVQVRDLLVCLVVIPLILVPFHSPGEMSAETGHHFGNPTNGFWRALHGSVGLTTAENALHPSEDGTMPERFCLGLTNLVSRPTNQANELSMTEKRAGAAAVLSKAARHRPRIVCYVGNEIADIMYEAVMKSHVVPRDAQSLTKPPPTRMAKRKGGPPRYGLEPYKIVHGNGKAVDQIRETLFFIMGSTSGRVANYKVSQVLRSGVVGLKA